MRTRGAEAERVLAAATGLVVGVRFPVTLHLPTLMFSLALLPLSVGTWGLFRGARLVSLTAFAAAASGVLLSVVTSSHATDMSLLRTDTAQVLMLGTGFLALLWARSVVGARLVVLTYGVGTLATLVAGFAQVGADNPWKFGYALPAILILLSQKHVYQRPVVECGALLALAAMSVLNDSRSLAAMLIIAAAVRFAVRPARTESRSSVRVAVGIGLISIGGFYLVQAMIAEGMLGEAAQARTQQQSELAGNVLLGGRPEAGAAVALVVRNPLGYGAGALPTPHDIQVAKEGMSSLNYDPDNGYVEHYMFGYGFEVHSLAGDLWIRYGLVGLVLAFGCVLLVSHGMVDALRHGAASGVMLFLAVRTIWDFAFSPFTTVMTTLMLALAVCLPPLHGRRLPTEQDLAEPVGARATPPTLGT
jgi:hypothetical protein